MTPKQLCARLAKSELSEISVWGILSALRGPDVGESEIKWVTTSRLRGRLDLTDMGGVDINYDEEEVDYQKADKVSSHFVAHLHTADWAIKRLLKLEKETPRSKGERK